MISSLSLLVGALALIMLTRTLAPLPPQTGPAPLWVSLLALGLAYAACCAVAAGLGVAPGPWPSRKGK